MILVVEFHMTTFQLHGINELALLQAIADVETASNDQARGRRGERGRYQIDPDTWHRFSKEPFTDAYSKTVSDIVAKKILSEYITKLRMYSHPISAYHLALCWRYGLSGYLTNRHILNSDISYGNRVKNLYSSYVYSSSQQVPSTSTPSLSPSGGR